MLYLLRTRFWPIHGKSVVRKVVHQCMTCFKNSPTTLQQIMGQLPIERINPSRPFQFCGVDFGGPFTIKENLVRTTKYLKVYVALFICLATRAVHIELVSGLLHCNLRPSLQLCEDFVASEESVAPFFVIMLPTSWDQKTN